MRTRGEVPLPVARYACFSVLTLPCMRPSKTPLTPLLLRKSVVRLFTARELRICPV